MEQAWAWRDLHVIPEQPTQLGYVRDSVLDQMELTAPQAAAFIRREREEAAAANELTKPTQTIARIQQLIVNQYGWPERD